MASESQLNVQNAGVVEHLSIVGTLHSAREEGLGEVLPASLYL